MGIITRKYKVKWKRGFHARPCTLFVKTTSQFYDCNVLVSNEKGETVDGKSLVGLLTLGVSHGKMLKVQITGSHNEKCAEELQELFDLVEENL